MVKKLLVHYGGPVAGKLQVDNGVGGEHEVLGGDVIAVAPLHALLQRDLGGPEGFTANGFLLQRRWEVCGQRGYPVEPLGGVAVKRGRASSQDVLVPDGSVRSQIGPEVGGGQIRRNAQLVHILYVLFGGRAGRRRLGNRRRGWLGGSADGGLNLRSARIRPWCGRDHHLNIPHHLNVPRHLHFPNYLNLSGAPQHRNQERQ